MAELTAEIARELLCYEPDTGKLFWRERDRKWFGKTERSQEWNCNAWNSKLAGKQTFLNIEESGALYSSIFRKKYKAHRIIWLMVNGKWPDDVIDHINGNRQDNRLWNLRSVTQGENMINMARPSHNTSGFVGVVWDKDRTTWNARITVNNKTINLGRFKTKSEAISKRQEANKEHGFHKNHGRELLENHFPDIIQS